MHSIWRTGKPERATQAARVASQNTEFTALRASHIEKLASRHNTVKNFKIEFTTERLKSLNAFIVKAIERCLT